MAELTYPVTTKNLNIRSMYESYQQIIEEIDKSLSKGTIGVSSADANRWIDYINSMGQYADFYQARAMLDWAVTNGRIYDLNDPLYPKLEFKENVAVHDLMDMIVSARDELVISASSGLPMHLYPADLARQKSYWEAMVGLITEYMLIVQPLDQPVTSAAENLGFEGHDSN